MIHDAEMLIKFAQRLIEFAPELDNSMTTSEALDMLKQDPDELDMLWDYYTTAYRMYIEPKK